MNVVAFKRGKAFQVAALSAAPKRLLGCLIVMVAAALAHPAPAHAQSSLQTDQSAEWAKVVAAAKKEAKVIFYSAAPPAITQLLVNGFKAANPDIAVEFQRMVAGEALAKLDQERAGKLDGADLWLTTEVSWSTDRAKEGALLKIVGPASANWPARYLRDGAVVIAGVEPYIILYNTKLVASPPRGYTDTIRPEFKGRMGTSELAATSSVAFYDWLEKTQGADFLVRLKAQEPRLFNGAVPAAQAVSSGEIALSAHGIPTATRPLMQLGAPIDYVVPNPAFGIEWALSVMGWARRPNAALVFADYLMSLNAQTAWHGAGGSASPLPGIKGSLDASTINAYNAAAYPPDLVKAYRERWTRIFK